MENLSSKASGAVSAMEGITETIILYLPNLIGAALLLIVGWFLGRLVRRGVTQLSDRLTRLLSRLFAGTRLENVGVTERTATLLGHFLFAVVLLIFFAAAVRVAEIPAFTAWLDKIVTYLPRLVASVIIVVIGIVAGILVRDLATAGLDAAGVARGRAMGRVAQVVVVAIALVMALEQVGIDATLLIILLAIIAAASAFSIAVAFGLGARHHVENLLAAQAMHRQFRVGQQVKIGDHSGEIVELTATMAAIQSEQGRVFIPARLLNQQVTVLLPEESRHD